MRARRESQIDPIHASVPGPCERARVGTRTPRWCYCVRFDSVIYVTLAAPKRLCVYTSASTVNRKAQPFPLRKYRQHKSGHSGQQTYVGHRGPRCYSEQVREPNLSFNHSLEGPHVISCGIHWCHCRLCSHPCRLPHQSPSATRRDRPAHRRFRARLRQMRRVPCPSSICGRA